MAKWILFALCIVAASGLRAKDVDGDFAAVGIGAYRCADYLEARRDHGGRERAYAEWLLGYLSAFNLIVPHTYHILGKSDLNDALGWLDGQCASTPEARFVNAVALMTQSLYDLRANLAPGKAAPPDWDDILGRKKNNDDS